MAAPRDTLAGARPAGLSAFAREPAELSTPAGSRIGINLSVLAGSQLATWSFALIWTLFVPRILGPEGIGLVVMAWTAMSLLQVIGGLGTKILLVKEIASDRAQAPTLLGTAFIVRAICSLACIAITVIYVRLGHFNGQAGLVLSLATAATICLVFLEPLQAAFQAIERMEFLAYTDIINKGLVAVCGIVLVLLGFGAVSLVGVMLVGAGTVLIMNALWIRPYFRIDLHVDRAAIRGFVAASMGYWAYALFLTIYLWIDSAMLALMTPPTVVGWYGVPTRLLSTLMFLPIMIGTAWLPRLAATFREAPGRLKDAARVPLELVTIVGLPLSIGSALVAGPFIRLLYGPQFGEAVPVFTILAFTIVPMYLNIIVYQILVASNRQSTWAKALAGAGVINVALNLVAIPYFQTHLHNGAIGAALSLLVTELLVVAVGIAIIHRYIDWQSVRRLGRVALATMGMAVAVLLLGRFGLGASIAAGVVCFSGLTLLLRVLTPDELRYLRGIVDRLRLPQRFGRFKFARG